MPVEGATLAWAKRNRSSAFVKSEIVEVSLGLRCVIAVVVLIVGGAVGSRLARPLPEEERLLIAPLQESIRTIPASRMAGWPSGAALSPSRRGPAPVR